MKYHLSLLLLFFLLFQSCHEESHLNGEEFYWDQTACSDPWNTGANSPENETIQAVKDYLKDKGVKGIREVSITNDGIEQDCKACFCTTGNRINVAVNIGQKSKMEELGFK